MTDKEKAIELLKEAKDDVVILNCIELLERSQIGVQKYGTTLSNADLSQKQLIQHALEESLDLSNYLRTILIDSLRTTLKPTFKDGMENKYVIIDLINMDYMKDESGKIKCYETKEEACLVCGMYEFQNVWVVKLEYNHMENQ